jgi:Flp pilus assembly protein TadG
MHGEHYEAGYPMSLNQASLQALFVKYRQAGQSLVEVALIIPIFTLMLFGLIDVGRLVYLNTTLSQAAREGARLASVEASWIGSTHASCGQPGGPVCPATVSALRTDVTTAVNRMVTPIASIAASSVYTSCDATTPPTGAWTAQTCVTQAPGSLASVRVSYTFTALTPVISQLLGSITLSGATTMTIN